MHPFTEEILKHTGPVGKLDLPFQPMLLDDIRRILDRYNLGRERQAQAQELAEAFPIMQSGNFDASYTATVTVMKLLYELQEVIPEEYFAASRAGTKDTGLHRLYFSAKPAPTSVVVNDWLWDVIWDKPGSLITYSEGEGRFHLVRPNSQGRLSLETQFLGNYHAEFNIWTQFKRIREVVSFAERLYREGKQSATRGARMEAFENW